jgi:glycosyltransferase involved in cell wall biosynthesis
LPRGIKGQVIELVENGVDFSIWQRANLSIEARNTTRFIFVGRLIDWKAVDIVLEAMQRIQHDVRISLEIIGEGPMRSHWQALANRLGLSCSVHFSGWLSQNDCARRLERADVLLLPSLFECGGAVILEAMAMGLPVIATAWGGPLDYLDETCGILVNPESRETLIGGFAGGMAALAASPSLRTRLGQAGQARVRQHFDWDRKVDKVLEFYRLAAIARRLGH